MPSAERSRVLRRHLGESRHSLAQVTRALLLATVVALVLPVSAFAWGGSFPTGDAYGSSVNVQVSASYPVDDTLPQQWATYLGTLVHGPELARLTLDLAPIDEVQAVCGKEALACYDPGTETILASPDDQLNAPPAQQIVAHEYGHHIANNRSDAPWVAESFGTKRWASYMNICSRTASGDLSPGNEGAAYDKNPGEAFAEAYRVLNLVRTGASDITWDIVDRSFYPDATALALLQEDITTPWTAPTVSQRTGSFGYGVARTFGLKTPLDGTLTARLHAPSAARYELALYAGSQRVAYGTSVRYSICGQRSLTLKVQRLSGHGAFTVDVSKP